MNREFTPDELARIWEQIHGSTPGLYIPITRHRVVEKLGPRLAVFRSYSEIIKGDPTAKYWQTLRETPRDAALATLSAINLINALAPTEPSVHMALNRTFIREEYVNELAELPKEKGPQPDLNILFSRGGILANLKALIACLPEDSEERPLDLHLIGDLTLLGNDFVGSTYLKTDPEKVEDIHLLSESVAVWEMDNPRDVAYALTRVERMIKTYLSSADPVIAKLRADIGMEPRDLQYDGLELDDYIAVIFGIYSHTKRFDVAAIFRKPGEAIIDPQTFVSQTHFPQDKFEQFLNQRSLSLHDYREHLTGGKEWDQKVFSEILKTDQFSTDTLTVKTYPLLRLADGRTLILDPQYVSDLLIYGLYWRIVDSLDDRKADRFISLWGRVFELYIFELLDHFYPPLSGILRTDIDYDGGQIDALLDFGADVIIFELKASLLRDQTKNKRDIHAFEKEVKLKFIENEKGKPKALKQLANAATAICNGVVKTSVKPVRVYPVFIGYEPTLECFLMNSYLQTKFRPFIAEKLNDVIVKPLTTISVDELERVLPNMETGSITWTELLNERFDHDRVRGFSVHQTLYDIAKKKGIEIVRNKFLLQGFDTIFAEIARRYQHPA